MLAIDRARKLALLFVLLLAFIVRVYGIKFGLPYLYYWDEPTVVNRAVRFGSGDLNPHFYSYPAFYMYVLFVVTGFTFVFGRVTGHYHSVQDFGAEYFLDPTRVYLSARLATACVGTLCVFMTYLVGKKFFGTRVGLAGALFLAVSVQHASHSHVAVTDVPQSLFILAAYLPLHHIMSRDRRRDYIIAGLLIGLGAATKYLAVLLVPTLLLAAWFRFNTLEEPALGLETTGGKQVKRCAPLHYLPIAFASIFTGFFIGSPYTFINFHTFLVDFRTQNTLSQGGIGNSYAYFLGKILPSDFGLLLFLTAISGMLSMVTRRAGSDRQTNWLFLLFPFIYFVFMARYPHGFARYMIPEDPFIALCAAYALSHLYRSSLRLLANSKWTALCSPAWALIVLLLAMPSLWRMLRWDSLMANTYDTRTQARLWMEHNVPSGTIISIQSQTNRTFFNAPLATDKTLSKIEEEIPDRGRLAQIREQVVRTLRSRPMYREIVWDEAHPTLEKFDRAGVAYVIVSDANPPLDAMLVHQLEDRTRRFRHSSIEFNPGSYAQEVCRNFPVWHPHISIYQLR